MLRPPSEVVAALRDGARVLGAASMGAIRAAECWPAGMQGVGAVYSLYRLGVISDDDEVGYGLLEVMTIGPHPQYFEGWD